jgi:uncharacterized protein YndB with AHSA1/START domain
MRSPDGKEFPNVGCYLEIVPGERLVWTNVLEPGFRPSSLLSARPSEELAFTAVITIERHGTGTKYTAVAIHGNEETRKRHEAMGFHDGWGKAFDQLLALVRRTS